MNIIKGLLDIEAIKLSPIDQFTLSSGAKSPIYCDNRMILSYPLLRKFIANEFVDKIMSTYSDVEVISGVATGAIGMGMLIAEIMQLPFIYVRPEPKKHGRKNQIEGKIEKEAKTVVIEDLLSTGGSSINAVRALKAAEVNVRGLIAIFTYEFDIVNRRFNEEDCEYHTLTNYSELIKYSHDNSLFSQSEIEILERWKEKGL